MASASTSTSTSSLPSAAAGQASEERPEWIPDQDASHCQACSDAFTVLNRRHHCRSCAHIFCSSCSSQSIAVPSLGYEQAVRVCDRCLAEVRLADAFARKHRPLLMRGAVFRKHNMGRGKPKLRHVRLNQDNDRIEWLDAESGKLCKSVALFDDAQEATSEGGQVQVRVLAGKQTDTFLRPGGAAAAADEALCLSVVTPARTLDLEALDAEQRADWLEALTACVQVRKPTARQEALQKQKRKAQEEEAEAQRQDVEAKLRREEARVRELESRRSARMEREREYRKNLERKYSKKKQAGDS